MAKYANRYEQTIHKYIGQGRNIREARTLAANELEGNIRSKYYTPRPGVPDAGGIALSESGYRTMKPENDRKMSTALKSLRRQTSSLSPLERQKERFLTRMVSKRGNLSSRVNEQWLDRMARSPRKAAQMYGLSGGGGKGSSGSSGG